MLAATTVPHHPRYCALFPQLTIYRLYVQVLGGTVPHPRVRLFLNLGPMQLINMKAKFQVSDFSSILSYFEQIFRRLIFFLLLFSVSWYWRKIHCNQTFTMTRYDFLCSVHSCRLSVWWGRQGSCLRSLCDLLLGLTLRHGVMLHEYCHYRFWLSHSHLLLEIL